MKFAKLQSIKGVNVMGGPQIGRFFASLLSSLFHFFSCSLLALDRMHAPMLDDAIAADDGRPFLSHWDGDASGSGIFDDDDNMADNAEEDGFNLLTQSNDLFKQDHATSDSGSDNGEGSDDSSSSGSSSDSSSSSEEDIKGESLEQLRAKNIRRNEAFANKLKLEMHAMLGKDEASLKNRRVQQKNDRREKY